MIKSVVDFDVENNYPDVPQVKYDCDLYIKQDRSDLYLIGDIRTEADPAIGSTNVEMSQNYFIKRESTSQVYDEMDFKPTPETDNVYIKEELQGEELIIKDDKGILDFNSSLDETTEKQVCSLDSELFKCSHCPYETKNLFCLNLHVVLHRDSGAVLQCSSCLYKTTRRSRYATHIVRHMPEEETQKIKCPDCSYESIGIHGMMLHTRHKKPGQEGVCYECQECPYKTTIKARLTTHSLTHGTKMFKCQQCSYEASRKWHFERHMLLHTRIEDWFSCSEPGCSYKTYDKFRLRDHFLVHNNADSIFKCLQCPYQSKRKQSLTKHQRKHENIEKWYSCELCSMKTATMTELRHHMKRHTDYSS